MLQRESDGPSVRYEIQNMKTVEMMTYRIVVGLTSKSASKNFNVNAISIHFLVYCDSWLSPYRENGTWNKALPNYPQTALTDLPVHNRANRPSKKVGGPSRKRCDQI